MNFSVRDVPYRVWKKPQGKDAYLVQTKAARKLLRIIGKAIKDGLEVDCAIRLYDNGSHSIRNNRPYEVIDLSIKKG